jgi:hypothetical protein
MIAFIAEGCLGALLGALTILTLTIVFLALCFIMKAIAYVLSVDFRKALSKLQE